MRGACLHELDHIRHRAIRQTPPPLIIEPVQGEYDYYPATTAFWKACASGATSTASCSLPTKSGGWPHRAFLEPPAFQWKPDLIIAAQGLASGYPLSAIAASKD